MSDSELLISANSEGLSRASALLRQGGLVAFPTETVYGLGANALDDAAVRSIFAAKGRPLTDPLIVHVVDQTAALDLLDISGEEASAFQSLGEDFWPGPLTLIAKAAESIPPAVTAGTGFVGVRVPAHPLAMELLQACQLPIAAPSANRFGHVSPTRAHHVLFDLASKGVHVLDGDGEQHSSHTCQHGIESTVAKINGLLKQVQIFRQGAVTQPQIEATLLRCGLSPDWTVAVVSRTVKMTHGAPLQAHDAGDVKVEIDDSETTGQEAPGQAITHYAPDVPCFIVSSFSIDTAPHLVDDVCKNVNASAIATADLTEVTLTKSALASVVVIDFAGQMQELAKQSLAYKDLSSSGSTSEGARQLFDALRWAELVPGATKILLPRVSEPPTEASGSASRDSSERDMTLGLVDRIFRAASGVTVTVRLALSREL